MKHVNAEELRNQARDMSIAEIAAENGLTYDGARHALRRRGLTAVVKGKDYRSVVNDMKPSDAIEYLLDCLDTLTGVSGQGAPKWGMTATQYRAFSCLVARPGHVCAKSAIYDAIYFDRHSSDELPDPKIVDVHICHIRQKIPAEEGQIKTVWGAGYVWEPAQ